MKTSVLSRLSVALLLVSPAFAQMPSFKARRDVPTGNHPVGAIVVDFDFDGLPDIVSVDQFDDTLSLIKGFGDGTFRRIRTVAVGSHPAALAFADANGDGRADLVAANLSSQEITVNLNDGHGLFGALIRSPLPGAAATGLAAGDWNGDGRLDAAVVAGSANALIVVVGDGAGHFGSPVSYTTGTGPKGVVAGDFNRDGKADLAVVNNSSASIQIWRGDGMAHFAIQSTLATGTSPQGLLAADLDNDSDLDLVVCNFGSDTTGVYINNGSGGFSSPALLSPGFGPRAALVADLNKDGKPDLFVTLSKVSGVGQGASLFGNGAGGFGAPSIAATGPVPNTAAAGDFNLDGAIDVAAVSLTGNVVSILLNTGAGAFLSAGRVALASGTYPRGVVAADLNLDGKADLAAADEGTDDVSVTYGDGAGGFAPPGAAINAGTSPGSIVAQDYNRDGNMDLLTANNGSDDLTYLQGTTGTSFGRYTLAAGCFGPVALATADVSGDMLSDLAVVCEGSNQLCTRRGTGASGGGAFGAPVCSALPGVPAGVVLGNLNGDAFADPAVSLGALSSVAVGWSDGAGGIAGPWSLTTVGLQPAGLARGDFNGDGTVDLVVANGGSNSLTVLPGGPGGPPPIESPAGLAPTALALADFNLDGRLDVAAVNANSNDVSLLLGDGAGRFSAAGVFGARDLPLALGAGDFDRDGKPDLAVADSFSDSLTILLNQSPSGDPLQWVSVVGGQRSVFRWGIVPGARYDVIRGSVRSIVPQSGQVDLGPVICVADDLIETDTAGLPDETNPAAGQAFFYLVRPVIGGVPGVYTIATDGRVGAPSSGGCN